MQNNSHNKDCSHCSSTHQELEAALSSEKASGQGFGCMERL